jgi:site-specific DNA-methyltransferase (adenine-specific)
MNPYQPPDDESQLDRIERRFELHHGDCLDVLKALADCSVDAIVTDPPYGLGKEPDPVKVMAAWILQGYFEVEGSGFMGKKWDAFVPQPIIWKEVFRVLKPGGHLLAFAGTRTQDWMAMSLRFAGFEIRDMIAWVYGSGFPKSMDISKQLDKAAGAEREVVGLAKGAGSSNTESLGVFRQEYMETAPATEAAKQWEGWGTSIKPALEPITLARKPLIGTVAANVLEHGTGGLNIDGCRVGTEGATKRSHQEPYGEGGRGDQGGSQNWRTGHKIEDINAGRWPANFIHDNSEQVLALFPETGPAKASDRGQGKGQTGCYGVFGGDPGVRGHDDDGGSAARFFYCAKASRDDRDEGCGAMELTEAGIKNDSGRGFSESDPMAAVMRHNPHPTVKPTDLMRYLCRLITPPNGIVLDPFTGSGSTGKAAMAEGFRFVGIEREAEYIEIARARISAEAEKPRQLSLF